MLLPFLLFSALFLAVSFWWRRRRFLAKWDHFPGPKGNEALPFLGHSFMLAEGPIKVALEMTKKYGKVFRLDLGPTPTVIVADYDLAKEMFKSDVRKRKERRSSSISCARIGRIALTCPAWP